ncbi:DUF1385 domain-containing protein [uncultured Slackia sp.]|uniref:DUF1385 domain-containing protein n=1 Tax=uncultured Slackia sp. TaxID=665903 RepID=UPI002586C017|nr:DUF1385 domain-containing protein [uncultured Slackia sp.]
MSNETECMPKENEVDQEMLGAAAENESGQAPSKRSAVKRAFAEDGANKTHVGGQALIEGVMMRGRYNWAAAVREPSGNIYIEEHDLASGKAKNKWLYWPVVRGCRAFVESLILGYKALEIAAMHAYGDEEEPGAKAEGASANGAVSKEDASFENASCVELADKHSRFCESSDEEKRASHEENGTSDAADSRACESLGEDKTEDSAREPMTESPVVLTGEKAADDASGFSWKNDFGNPDEAIDALGAQRSLDIVVETNAAEAGAVEPNAVEPGAAASESDETRDGDDGGFGKREMAISMALGLLLGVGLFIVAPAFIANVLVGEYDDKTLLWNVVDGIVRIVVFVFYIWLIGRMQDIKRMFSYHGAEHKTIHCYEHGLPLTPENARSFPRLHVRCGTAFLIMVMIIAIFVYTITPLNGLIAAWGVPDGPAKLALVIVARILLMPVIAGISYEITVKWAGSHPENPLVKVVLWPGMQMQRLTTNEPDDEMLECAIAAMQRVLEREEREEAARA